MLQSTVRADLMNSAGLDRVRVRNRGQLGEDLCVLSWGSAQRRLVVNLESAQRRSIARAGAAQKRPEYPKVVLFEPSCQALYFPTSLVTGGGRRRAVARVWTRAVFRPFRPFSPIYFRWACLVSSELRSGQSAVKSDLDSEQSTQLVNSQTVNPALDWSTKLWIDQLRFCNVNSVYIRLKFQQTVSFRVKFMP
ncbi:hypothetical protein F511_09230 [Dorcoceras hygrometricum]|uniref:Uncharacterized protein n=1 Tax=Dorcoceras hygrometricum TaxID=472368 RepID=A0A2Z7CVY2_9LAMI|nr:hypothetical protein F511_09230 [Dorcoceras hygrometricum]